MQRRKDVETGSGFTPLNLFMEREKNLIGAEELERTIRALLESLRFIHEVSGASPQNLVGTSEIVGALYQIAKCLLQITPPALYL